MRYSSYHKPIYPKFYFELNPSTVTCTPKQTFSIIGVTVVVCAAGGCNLPAGVGVTAALCILQHHTDEMRAAAC